jgi:hypothetical protein
MSVLAIPASQELRPERCQTRQPSWSDGAETLRARTANSLPSRRWGSAGGGHEGRHAARERAAGAMRAAMPRRALGHSGCVRTRCAVRGAPADATRVNHARAHRPEIQKSDGRSISGPRGRR